MAVPRLVALALLAATALAACGGSASAPPATPAPAIGVPPADPPVTPPEETPAAETASPATPATVDPAVVDAIDACALLTAAEVAAAFGVPVEPMAGSTALPGSRTCFYRPPGTEDGPQVNVAVLALPDYSRPAAPSPVAGLETQGGVWWIDTLTGDLKLEAVAPSGIRLTLAYQDTAAGTPLDDGALALLVPLAETALGELP